jgi:hypothetical protein
MRWREARAKGEGIRQATCGRVGHSAPGRTRHAAAQRRRPEIGTEAGRVGVPSGGDEVVVEKSAAWDKRV